MENYGLFSPEKLPKSSVLCTYNIKKLNKHCYGMQAAVSLGIQNHKYHKGELELTRIQHWKCFIA
jgi:hypothetical protein